MIECDCPWTWVLIGSPAWVNHVRVHDVECPLRSPTAEALIGEQQLILVSEHLHSHMTDGYWHDDCAYCITRRRSGGTGVPDSERAAYDSALAAARVFPQPQEGK